MGSVGEQQANVGKGSVCHHISELETAQAFGDGIEEKIEGSLDAAAASSEGTRLREGTNLGDSHTTATIGERSEVVEAAVEEAVSQGEGNREEVFDAHIARVADTLVQSLHQMEQGEWRKDLKLNEKDVQSPPLANRNIRLLKFKRGWHRLVQSLGFKREQEIINYTKQINRIAYEGRVSTQESRFSDEVEAVKRQMKPILQTVPATLSEGVAQNQTIDLGLFARDGIPFRDQNGEPKFALPVESVEGGQTPTYAPKEDKQPVDYCGAIQLKNGSGQTIEIHFVFDGTDHGMKANIANGYKKKLQNYLSELCKAISEGRSITDEESLKALISSKLTSNIVPGSLNLVIKVNSEAEDFQAYACKMEGSDSTNFGIDLGQENQVNVVSYTTDMSERSIRKVEQNQGRPLFCSSTDGLMNGLVHEMFDEWVTEISKDQPLLDELGFKEQGEEVIREQIIKGLIPDVGNSLWTALGELRDLCLNKPEIALKVLKNPEEIDKLGDEFSKEGLKLHFEKNPKLKHITNFLKYVDQLETSDLEQDEQYKKLPEKLQKLVKNFVESKKTVTFQTIDKEIGEITNFIIECNEEEFLREPLQQAKNANREISLRRFLLGGPTAGESGEKPKNGQKMIQRAVSILVKNNKEVNLTNIKAEILKEHKLQQKREALIEIQERHAEAAQKLESYKDIFERRKEYNQKIGRCGRSLDRLLESLRASPKNSLTRRTTLPDDKINGLKNRLSQAVSRLQDPGAPITKAEKESCKKEIQEIIDEIKREYSNARGKNKAGSDKPQNERQSELNKVSLELNGVMDAVIKDATLYEEVKTARDKGGLSGTKVLKDKIAEEKQNLRKELDSYSELFGESELTLSAEETVAVKGNPVETEQIKILVKEKNFPNISPPNNKHVRRTPAEKEVLQKFNEYKKAGELTKLNEGELNLLGDLFMREGRVWLATKKIDIKIQEKDFVSDAIEKLGALKIKEALSPPFDDEKYCQEQYLPGKINEFLSKNPQLREGILKGDKEALQELRMFLVDLSKKGWSTLYQVQPSKKEEDIGVLLSP